MKEIEFYLRSLCDHARVMSDETYEGYDLLDGRQMKQLLETLVNSYNQEQVGSKTYDLIAR